MPELDREPLYAKEEGLMLARVGEVLSSDFHVHEPCCDIQDEESLVSANPSCASDTSSFLQM